MSKQHPSLKKWVRQGAVLSPADRISEVLYGLIMALTFTGAIRVSGNNDQNAAHELLWTALSCNLAWGLVDAVMYLMGVLSERGHEFAMIRKVVRTKEQERAHKLLRSEMQPFLADLLDDEALDKLSDRLKKLPPNNRRLLLTWPDVWVATQIFLLVFLCTFPVALPFAVVQNVQWAIYFSNGIALGMLFIGGFIMAKYAGFQPWITAFAFTLFGICLVAITVLLGG